MKRFAQLAGVAAGLSLLVLAFQNCSGDFKALRFSGSSDESSSELQTSTVDTCHQSPQRDCEAIQKAYNEVLMREPGRDEVATWQTRIDNQELRVSDISSRLAMLPEAEAVVAASADRSIDWGPWVLAVSGRDKDLHPLKSFNSLVGKPASVAGFNTWWHVSSPWGDFNTTVRDWMNGVRSQGATPVILWNPMDISNGKKCTDPDYHNFLKSFTTRAIAAGTHDAYIRRWARQARDWGHPFHLRVFHENNAKTVTSDLCSVPTKVWDADMTLMGEVVGTRQDSINAWRHVVNLFRQEGATNVKWMWSVLSWPSANFGGTNSVALKDIYPGDDYVDSIGIECYAFSRTNLESCEHLMRAAYSEAAALSPTKPIWNIEMGAFASSEKANWIRQALDLSHTQNTFSLFPRLKGFMYWDDSREIEGLHSLWIKSDQNSVNAFRTAVSNPIYAEGSMGGSDDTRSGCRSLDGMAMGHAGVSFFFSTPQSNACEKNRIARACVEGQITSLNAQDSTYKYSTCGNGTLDAVQARMVVVDAYQSVIGRNESETLDDTAGIAHFVSKLMQGTTVDQVISQMRGSHETFVRQQFITIMGRRADLPGLRYYVEALNAGTKTRQQVIADLQFAVTSETGTTISLTQARQVVTDLFINVMGRTQSEIDGDPSGLAFYVEQYRAGTKTTAQIRNDFLASDEYFVRQQYLNILRRRADIAGLKSFVAMLAAGTKTRTQIVNDFNFFCTNKIGGECS